MNAFYDNDMWKDDLFINEVSIDNSCYDWNDPSVDQDIKNTEEMIRVYFGLED